MLRTDWQIDFNLNLEKQKSESPTAIRIPYMVRSSQKSQQEEAKSEKKGIELTNDATPILAKKLSSIFSLDSMNSGSMTS